MSYFPHTINRSTLNLSSSSVCVCCLALNNIYVLVLHYGKTYIKRKILLRFVLKKSRIQIFSSYIIFFHLLYSFYHHFLPKRQRTAKKKSDKSRWYEKIYQNTDFLPILSYYTERNREPLMIVYMTSR